MIAITYYYYSHYDCYYDYDYNYDYDYSYDYDYDCDQYASNCSDGRGIRNRVRFSYG